MLLSEALDSHLMAMVLVNARGKARSRSHYMIGPSLMKSLLRPNETELFRYEVAFFDELGGVNTCILWFMHLTYGFGDIGYWLLT